MSEIINKSVNDGFQYLEQYSKFNSIEEMNDAIKQHIYAHYKKLNRTDLAILECLARHSLRYIGVSKLLAKTISQEINRSSKTVYRNTKKLRDLNIIKIIETKKKKSNLKGTNIFGVILPFNSSSSEEECPNENVLTKVSQQSNNEKPQNNNNESQNSEQESNNSLISYSLKNNTLNNTYQDVATIQKKYLYKKLHDMYKSDPRNSFKDFTDIKMIIGGNYNKYANKIGLASLEKILVDSMKQILNSTNVKSDFKLFSYLVNKSIKALLNPDVKPYHQTNRDNIRYKEHSC